MIVDPLSSVHLFNPFSTHTPLLYPPKTEDRFSDVFRGYTGANWLKIGKVFIIILLATGVKWIESTEIDHLQHAELYIITLSLYTDDEYDRFF